eukprot:scaffold707_cov399-Prasinococcus_capsulatus_cf.AAC.8
MSTAADCLRPHPTQCQGDSNRAIGEHHLNKESSRSHTIFTLSLEIQTHAGADSTVHSKLNLVDLAGSERLSRTGSEGLVAREAQFINKSLSFLEQVIVALGGTWTGDKRRGHIPYRSSKLTQLLKDSLGGNCNTVMIANVCSEPAHVLETLATFKFASRYSKAALGVHCDEQQAAHGCPL